MTKRSSTGRRAALWSREATNAYLDERGRFPICNLCGLPVQPGQDWDESHGPVDRAFGGRRTQIAHRRCNRDHGTQLVTPALAKSNRVRAKHIGAAGPGLGKHPMPGGRRDALKRTIGGRVVPRLTLGEKLALTLAKRELAGC